MTLRRNRVNGMPDVRRAPNGPVRGTAVEPSERTRPVTAPAMIDHRSTSGYSLALAYWLAQASDLAYKDEATIEARARDWGFETVRHHHTRFTPPFPLEDTQAYTAASDHMIITAFRGTEPAQIRDWLSDATTPPWPGPDRLRPLRLRRSPPGDLPRPQGHPDRTAHRQPDGVVHRP